MYLYYILYLQSPANIILVSPVYHRVFNIAMFIAISFITFALIFPLPFIIWELSLKNFIIKLDSYEVLSLISCNGDYKVYFPIFFRSKFFLRILIWYIQLIIYYIPIIYTYISFFFIHEKYVYYIQGGHYVL